MKKRIKRKRNRIHNRKIFNHLFKKFIENAGFTIVNQVWLSGLLIKTDNTDQYTRFRLKELPYVIFGATIRKDYMEVYATHDFYLDKLKPSHCEFSYTLFTESDTLTMLEDLKDCLEKPYLLDKISQEDYQKEFEKYQACELEIIENRQWLIDILETFLKNNDWLYAISVEEEYDNPYQDFKLIYYIDPSIELDYDKYKSLDNLVHQHFDVDLFESYESIINYVDVLGLYRPTAKPELSNKTHGQKIKILNKIYDAELKEQHTKLLFREDDNVC